MLERLLIVGLGSIGSRHARLVRELLPGVQIVALRRPGYGGGSAPGIGYCVTNMDDALRHRPQAAVIANPASHHLEVAIPLANAGVHLLVEKPVASAIGGVAELIDACRKQAVVLMTGYNLRFLPSLQRFRQMLGDRCVGRVLSVRAEIGQFLPSWRPGTDYRQTVSARAALGGGVLLELSHEIDYLRWLFGEVDWVSGILRRQSSLELDVEDTAHLVLGFACAGDATPVIADLNLDFVRHDTVRCCTVIGETGSLRWNALAGTVEIFEQSGDAWQTLFAYRHHRDESYLAQWRHFLECIAGRETPLVGGSEALAVLRIVEAARRSSATGATALVENSHVGVRQPRETA